MSSNLFSIIVSMVEYPIIKREFFIPSDLSALASKYESTTKKGTSSFFNIFAMRQRPCPYALLFNTGATLIPFVSLRNSFIFFIRADLEIFMRISGENVDFSLKKFFNQNFMFTL